MRFTGWLPGRAAARRRRRPDAVGPEPVVPEAADRTDDPAPSRFVVRRMDDHGNVYDVSRHATHEEARARADELEARAHKQTYWVTELPD